MYDKSIQLASLNHLFDVSIHNYLMSLSKNTSIFDLFYIIFSIKYI